MSLKTEDRLDAPVDVRDTVHSGYTKCIKSNVGERDAARPCSERGM